MISSLNYLNLNMLYTNLQYMICLVSNSFCHVVKQA